MTNLRPRRTVSSAPPVKKAVAPRSSTHAPANGSGRAFALDIPFEARGIASAAGARWDADLKVFVFRGEKLPSSLRPWAAAPYSLEAWVERRLNEDSVAVTTPGGEIVLRPHQREAVEAIGAARAAGLPGFLLADDVGLGKTISTWAAILADDEAETVLIVAPLSVVPHWRRTIAAMGDGGKEVLVINHERLGKLFALPASAQKATPKKAAGKKKAARAAPKVRTQKGLARRGEAMAFDAVVFDESHRLKNPTTARAKFAAKLTAAADFTLWLSATAGQNPLELSYLAPLLAATTGDKASNLKDFEAWCQGLGVGVSRGGFGRWEWRGDPADCETMRALLFDAGKAGVPAALRRRPEDIAGWPELNRILAPIGLEGEARALYEEAWTAFRAELDLAPKGRDPKGALAATLRLRQKSSLLRAAGTAELARELLESGHQVAISVAFLESLEAIAEALEGDAPIALIHGRMPAAEREDERLRFQRGDARVCLFTVEEGISLHQGEHNEVPRSEIIHDLRWSAIQMAQIEGRCHRDGRFAQAYWVFADETIEERIAQVVCKRILSMKGMIGDDAGTLEEIDALLRG